MAGLLETYTHGHARAVVSSHGRRTAEVYACRALPHLDECASVLDVGCGPGSITMGFARRLPAGGRVVGVDLASQVLETARTEWATQAAASPGAQRADCEFLEANAYELPFADGEFDMVHAHQVLQHVQEPVRALREMCRVSRRFVCVREQDFASWCWLPENPRMEEWRRMWQEVARLNGGEPCAGRHLRKWAREAGLGLGQVSVFTDSICYASPEQTKVWGESWAQRILSPGMSDQAVENGICTREATHEMAEAWRAWSQDQDATLFYTDVSAVADKTLSEE